MAPRKSAETEEVEGAETVEVETQTEEAPKATAKGPVAYWFIDPNHNYAPTLVRKPVESGPGGVGIRQEGEYVACACEILPGPIGAPRARGRKVSVRTAAKLVDVQHDVWEGLEACQKALEAECSKASGGKKVIFVSTGFVAGKE